MRRANQSSRAKTPEISNTTGQTYDEDYLFRLFGQPLRIRDGIVEVRAKQDMRMVVGQLHHAEELSADLGIEIIIVDFAIFDLDNN